MLLSAHKKWMVAVAVAVIAAVPIVNELKPSDPEYQGRPLSDWFKELPPVGIANNTSLMVFKRFDPYLAPTTRTTLISPQEQMALLAVHKLGTNALPYVLQEFQLEPAPFLLRSPRFRKWADACPPLRRWAATNAYERLYRHYQAGAALFVIEPLTPKTVAELQVEFLYHSKQPLNANDSALIDPEARAAFQKKLLLVSANKHE